MGYKALRRNEALGFRSTGNVEARRWRLVAVLVVSALSLLGGKINPVAADPVTNIQELKRLPKYCRGTGPIREISRDKTPVESYEKIYGPTFRHLHHYCWALNSINHALGTSDEYLRKSKLYWSLKDIQYVLERADQKFTLLPEIYATQSSVFFMQKDYPNAITAIRNAIKHRPTYVRGYAQMSDILLASGRRADAVNALKIGYAKTSGAPPIAKRLKQLGENP